jgi:hypothetical protein
MGQADRGRPNAPALAALRRATPSLRGRDAALAGLAALLLGGALALGSPLDSEATTGWPLLERAFALQFLVATASGFLAFERLFRLDSLPILKRFPVAPSPIARERFVRCLADTAGLTALSLLTLLPSWALHHHLEERLVTALYMVVSVPLVAAATFGAIVGAIRASQPASSAAGSIARRFDLGPPAALAVTSVLLLLLELGMSEPLRALRDLGSFRLLRSAWLAIGLAIVPAFVLARSGIRSYASEFFRLGALFDETERYRPPIASDRFAHEFRRASRWEAGLSMHARVGFRIYRLYVARLEGPSRFATAVGGLVLLLFALTQRQSTGVAEIVATTAAMWMLLGARPHVRVDRTPGMGATERGAHEIPSEARRDARTRAVLRETALHAGLLLPSMLALPLRMIPAGVAALACACACIAWLPPRRPLGVLPVLIMALALASIFASAYIHPALPTVLAVGSSAFALARPLPAADESPLVPAPGASR